MAAGPAAGPPAGPPGRGRGARGAGSARWRPYSLPAPFSLPPPPPRCRHALPLFTSLLNTVCAYDPVGYGIPYNHLLFSDYREPLAEEAVQVLIVTLDHDHTTSASPTVDGTTTGTAMDDADVRTGGALPASGWVAPPLAELGAGYPVGTWRQVWSSLRSSRCRHCRHLGLGRRQREGRPLTPAPPLAASRAREPVCELPVPHPSRGGESSPALTLVGPLCPPHSGYGLAGGRGRQMRQGCGSPHPYIKEP